MRSPAPVSTGMTPLVVFRHNGKDIVVAGAGSEVYLLDSASLGRRGSSHADRPCTPVGALFAAAFASWEDPETGADGFTRPFRARNRVWRIAAFTLEERDGRPALSPNGRRATWSRLPRRSSRTVLCSRCRPAARSGDATLYILDAATGKAALHERRHRDRRRATRTRDWRSRTAVCTSAPATTRCTASAFRRSISVSNAKTRRRKGLS